MTRLDNVKSDGSTISCFDYTYNAAGNRTRVAEVNGDRVTYSYDNTSQLLAEHRSGLSGYAQTFTYDAAGNRIKLEKDGSLTRSEYDAAVTEP